MTLKKGSGGKKAREEGLIEEKINFYFLFRSLFIPIMLVWSRGNKISTTKSYETMCDISP